MRKLALLLFVLPALSDAGGSRWIQTHGEVPTTCAASDSSGDGLALKDLEACRATVRAVDGGSINGGKLVPYYCEVGTTTAPGWQEGPAIGVCALEAASRVDGGANRVQQVCEWTVINSFGRVAVAAYGLTGTDGGTANGYDGADGGNGAQSLAPVVRLECFGKSLGTPAGATP